MGIYCVFGTEEHAFCSTTFSSTYSIFSPPFICLGLSVCLQVILQSPFLSFCLLAIPGTTLFCPHQHPSTDNYNFSRHISYPANSQLISLPSHSPFLSHHPLAVGPLLAMSLPFHSFGGRLCDKIFRNSSQTTISTRGQSE